MTTTDPTTTAVTPFLLAVARHHATGDLTGVTTPDRADWHVDVARSGMLGLAVSALRAAGQPVADHVAHASLGDVAMHLRTLSDLRLVTDVLEPAGVRWLVLKGPVLAEHTYRGNQAIRRYNDLDLLIHPADFERGLDLLCAGPARLVDRNWEMVDRLDRGELLLTAGTGTVLDLHWHLLNRPAVRAAIPLDVRMLFDHAQTVTVGGGLRVPTYDDVDLLVHVALHAALSGGHLVRWLLDIQQAAARVRDDPGAVARRAGELGGLLAVRVMVARAARHLDPSLLSFAEALGRPGSWAALCRVVDRATVLDADAGTYSGRVVFSSTRHADRSSWQALGRNGLAAARLGSDRRSKVVDRAALHRDVPAPAHRRAWLDRVTNYPSD